MIHGDFTRQMVGTGERGVFGGERRHWLGFHHTRSHQCVGGEVVVFSIGEDLTYLKNISPQKHAPFKNTDRLGDDLPLL